VQKSEKSFIWASWARNGRFGVFFEKNWLGPVGVKEGQHTFNNKRNIHDSYPRWILSKKKLKFGGRSLFPPTFSSTRYEIDLDSLHRKGDLMCIYFWFPHGHKILFTRKFLPWTTLNFSNRWTQQLDGLYPLWYFFWRWHCQHVLVSTVHIPFHAIRVQHV
jgi:hypothetical protein